MSKRISLLKKSYPGPPKSFAAQAILPKEEVSVTGVMDAPFIRDNWEQVTAAMPSHPTHVPHIYGRSYKS